MWAAESGVDAYTPVSIAHLASNALGDYHNMMKLTTTLTSFFLAAQTLAQTTPSGFLPATNVTLDVYYGTQYISPGLIVKKSSP
jgi:hypothetical protein